MEEEGPMFHKKTFMFFGFDETHEKEMEKFLLEKGGKREEISSNVCKSGVVKGNICLNFCF